MKKYELEALIVKERKKILDLDYEFNKLIAEKLYETNIRLFIIKSLEKDIAVDDITNTIDMLKKEIKTLESDIVKPKRKIKRLTIRERFIEAKSNL